MKNKLRTILEMLNTQYQDRNTDEYVRLVALRYIDYNSQALNITFTCNSPREQCKLFKSLFIFYNNKFTFY